MCGVAWCRAQALSPTAESYNRELQYGNSKLANILFTRSLEAKLAGSGAHAYCCHPGVVRTELTRHDSAMTQVCASPYLPTSPPYVLTVTHYLQMSNTIGVVLLKTPLDGAQTQLYLATDPNAKPVVYVTPSSAPFSSRVWSPFCCAE